MTADQRRKMEYQFSVDYNCSPEDFQSKETLVTGLRKKEGARKFIDEDSILNILVYNGKMVISASEPLLPWCDETLKNRTTAEWCFEFDSLNNINQKLKAYGYTIDQVHLFFVPKYVQPDSGYRTKILSEMDIIKLKEDARIDEAFLFNDHVKDVLGVALVSDTDELLAVAGATANSDHMWELGYNSFIEGKGYGKAVLTRLVNEVIHRGKLPYCGTALSHLSSQNLALRAGLVPGFAELRTVKL